jgi:hypothetical protein
VRAVILPHDGQGVSVHHSETAEGTVSAVVGGGEVGFWTSLIVGLMFPRGHAVRIETSGLVEKGQTSDRGPGRSSPSPPDASACSFAELAAAVNALRVPCGECFSHRWCALQPRRCVPARRGFPP